MNPYKLLFHWTTDGSNPHSPISRVRATRYRALRSLTHPSPGDLVLDLGCGSGAAFAQLYGRVSRVLGLDIRPPARGSFSAFVLGDGRALPFKDRAFDLLVSSAVIEHVGDWDNQRRFANECRRVASRLFITTPNRHFPWEFHTGLPFYQFLPEKAQRWLVSHFQIGPWRRGDYEPISLLTKRDLELLFTDCLVLPEKTFGLTTGWIVVRETKERAE